MGRIFCIMGKSASGKDTVYRRVLEAEPSLGTCVMYTTRPIREGEIPGETYHYVKEEELAAFRVAGRLIESRTYDTVYGPWTYATVDDGSIRLSERDYLFPGTLESYRRLKAYFGEENVVPLYIEVEDGERLRRALLREMKEEKPKYREVCRRFLADCEDFSEEKLAEAGIVRRFANTELESCVAAVLEEIRKNEKL